jgi:hypothetical protein
MFFRDGCWNRAKAAVPTRNIQPVAFPSVKTFARRQEFPDRGFSGRSACEEDMRAAVKVGQASRLPNERAGASVRA